MGGCDLTVETTVTRTPLRWTASTKRRKSPSPENSTAWSRWAAISSMSTAISMSILPLVRDCPVAEST